MTLTNSKELIPNFKNDILQASYPPKYSFDKNYYSLFSDLFNCYAYALQLKTYLSIKEQDLYSPGNISEVRKQLDFTSLKQLIYCVMADCDTLRINVKFSTPQEQLRKKWYKIALILDDQYWHIVRQNQSQTWSEKNGWQGNVRLIGHDLQVKYPKNEYQILKLQKRNPSEFSK